MKYSERLEFLKRIQSHLVARSIQKYDLELEEDIKIIQAEIEDLTQIISLAPVSDCKFPRGFLTISPSEISDERLKEFKQAWNNIYIKIP